MVAAALSISSACIAQTAKPQTFSQALQAILAEPVFQHANFGVELYSLDTQTPVFSLNAEKLFTPGSTTKLLTEGTALQLLGPDYRFHTSVYRTGDVDAQGTLQGDLILVASGDPNLSSRVQADDTLAFENEDHSYGGLDAEVVPGDPLVVLREFANQIFAHGIRKVEGRVLVDTTLFRAGVRELGTGVIISPVSVNDNVVDLTVTPGQAVGAAAWVSVSPAVPWLSFDNKITTGALGTNPEVNDRSARGRYGDEIVTVNLTGSIPIGNKPFLVPYAVPDPVRFAESLLSRALSDKGIVLEAQQNNADVDFAAMKKYYTLQNSVAEHVSPPLSEEAKVTLKVSQNLHASMMPYILGAILGHAAENADAKGLELEHDLLEKAGLDLSGAAQGDGAGGAESAFFTPDFMVHFLDFMAQQPTFAVFHRALPVLGRDGTLVKIQAGDPAAGHVFAKTGTFEAIDLLNNRFMLVGKGLAGYMTTSSGQKLAFALYANHVSLPHDPQAIDQVAGQALGAIAAAAWRLPIDKAALETQ
ncbi:MAG: D-alanyl-D-alanine carboxypeptidase/D-alanyl-D-alanine-endopeptidase [Terracidiphilus sp.]